MLAHGTLHEDHLSRCAVASTLKRSTLDSKENEPLPAAGTRRLYPCLTLLQLGVAWPLHYGSAGGLLRHLFTLTRGGGMSLWPDPVSSSVESSLRVLPGSLLCGARTFLEALMPRDPLVSLTIL